MIDADAIRERIRAAMQRAVDARAEALGIAPDLVPRVVLALPEPVLTDEERREIAERARRMLGDASPDASAEG